MTSNNMYYFVNYIWIKEVSQLDINRVPQAPKFQQGESFLVLKNIHPFKWVGQVKNEEGVIISLRGFNEISEAEYELCILELPQAVYVSKEDREKENVENINSRIKQ